MNLKLSRALSFFASAAVLAASQLQAQQSTAFTYQGQLHDTGTNANGTYTMLFALYDSAGGGNQIGSTVTTSPTLANGLFTVNLDFGASAFNGGARWLDITVSNGPDTQELSPRVQVLPAPYAQFAAVAATVTNGAIMNPQLANNAVNANNIAGGQVVKSLNGLSDAITLSAGANVSITPSGNTLQISSSGGGGGPAIAPGNNVGFFTNSGITQISSFVPNFVIFSHATNANFTVPTNVTRITVEMWGAGGGGGAGYNDGTNMYTGGGGGAGAYALSVLTVAPGSSYSVTAPEAINGSQNGAASSFTGNSISIIAAGGSAGSDATAGGNGTGGSGGTSTGGSLNVKGGGGDNSGDGGAVWRGGRGELQGGAGGGGPGGGGSGGGPGNSGNSGNSGLVILYY